MAEPPELWTFLAFNLIILIFGGVLTSFSYLTYLRNGGEQFWYATIGFALVTLGGLVEPFYQMLVKGTYRLAGRELLAIQSIEGLLVGIGLATLFYSIYTFTPTGGHRSSRERDWDSSHELEQKWRP